MKGKAKGIIAVIAIGFVTAFLACGAWTGVSSAVKQANCNHVWDEGTVKVEATCEDEGKMVYKCEECGKTKTEKIDETDVHADDNNDNVCDDCKTKLG